MQIRIDRETLLPCVQVAASAVDQMDGASPAVQGGVSQPRGSMGRPSGCTLE